MLKLAIAVFLSGSSFYLEGCADMPDSGAAQEQQLQRSYAAPGQPIKPLDDPDASTRQPVPGE